MKKILLAVATVLTLSHARAESESVTIYGRVEPSYDVMKVGRTRIVNMNSNSSRVGFKGGENLGGGWQAVFKLEDTFDMANEGKFTKARDTYLGIAGPIGRLLFGHINSAYKEASEKYDPFDDTIGDYKTVMGMGYNADSPGKKKIKQGDANQRYSRTVYYESPAWNGLTVLANYAIGDEARIKSDDPDEVSDKTAWSAAAIFNRGPLNLLAAYDRQKKNDGTTEDLRSWKAGAAYTLPFGTVLRGIYERIKKPDATYTLDTEHWLIGVEHQFGRSWTVMADAIWAEDKRADQAGARLYNLGAQYAFSKRTSVMAVYSYLKNEENANYKNDADDDNYVAKGGIIQGGSVRLQHRF